MPASFFVFLIIAFMQLMFGSNVQLEKIAHLYQKPLQELLTLQSFFLIFFVVFHCPLCYFPLITLNTILKPLKDSSSTIFLLSSNLPIYNFCLLYCVVGVFPIWERVFVCLFVCLFLFPYLDSQSGFTRLSGINLGLLPADIAVAKEVSRAIVAYL